MMQTFQLRQDKKRLQEDILHSKEQLEAQNSELRHLKLAEKDFAEEIQVLRRVVSDLKERLEESEWSLCQRNGEVALMKTQLKEAQVSGSGGAMLKQSFFFFYFQINFVDGRDFEGSGNTAA